MPRGGGWCHGTRGDAGPLPHREAVWNRGTHGDTRALPCSEAGLVPWDTWRRYSPPALGGRSGTAGHVATPEPSLVGRRAQCHGARGDAGALPCRMWGLAPWELT
jgi:hypothetical protein